MYHLRNDLRNLSITLIEFCPFLDKFRKVDESSLKINIEESVDVDVVVECRKIFRIASGTRCFRVLIVDVPTIYEFSFFFYSKNSHWSIIQNRYSVLNNLIINSKALYYISQK